MKSKVKVILLAMIVAITSLFSWAGTSTVSLSGIASSFVIGPSGISLSHTLRSKNFTVSWTAGTGNGGPGGCKLQFRNASLSWVDLLSVNCDANGSAIGTISLPSDGWYGGSWSSVDVRLLRVMDSSVLGTVGQLTCSSTTGAASATPSLDENCNNQWDDTTSSSYVGCPGSQSCGQWEVAAPNLGSAPWGDCSAAKTIIYSYSGQGNCMDFGGQTTNCSNHPIQCGYGFGTYPNCAQMWIWNKISSTSCTTTVVTYY